MERKGRVEVKLTERSVLGENCLELCHGERFSEIRCLGSNAKVIGSADSISAIRNQVEAD
jgi:hypothetical protein